MSTTSFPVGGREIVERMTRKFPDLFVNEDEQQRKLTRKINEQFAFVYGTKWGGKRRAGVSDALQSKDSMAVQEDDGTTSVWDMFSSGLAILVNDGDMPAPGTHANLPPSEAAFMPVSPTNWLGTTPDPQPEPEPEPEPHPDPELEARIAALEATVDDQEKELQKTQDEVAVLRQHLFVLQNSVLTVDDVLKVIGKSEATWGHQHQINLTVSRLRQT